EISVQRGHHLCALADRAADAFDRARAHVADREHAGHGGFQRRHRTLAILAVADAGQHETGAVHPDAAAFEPAGRGIGPDEKKEIADIHRVLLRRKTAAPAHALERGVLIALHTDHFG